MLNFFLAGVLLTMACPIKSIDEKLAPVLEEIKVQQAAACEVTEPHKYTVQLMPSSIMPEESLGVCYKSIFAANIWINQAYWDKLDSTGRFQLVAHEYSHCVLDKQHVQDYSNYMYPVFVELFYTDIAKQLKANTKEYCDRKRLEDLFSKNSRLIK